MNDERFVYGFGCTWFGSIRQVEWDTAKQPRCPLCRELLYELPSEADFWKGVEEFELGTYPSEKSPPIPHPGYRAMFEWQRQNELCFTDISGLREAYKALTGIEVSVAA